MDDSINVSIEYLNKIADHCPRALGTYLMCWRRADDNLQLTLSRQVISDELATYTRTINDLRLLAREGLLEFYHMQDIICITLAAYDTE